MVFPAHTENIAYTFLVQKTPREVKQGILSESQRMLKDWANKEYPYAVRVATSIDANYETSARITLTVELVERKGK